MITVGSPLTILSGPPRISITVSPMRQAGRLLIITVFEPSITKPGPCGTGIGGVGMGHMCMLAPVEAIAPAIAFAAVVRAIFPAVSAAIAAGAAGVPDAAFVADSKVFIATSAAAFAACNAAPAPVGSASHAGRNPIRTLGLGGPGANGIPWAVTSDNRAAGPWGIVSIVQARIAERNRHLSTDLDLRETHRYLVRAADWFHHRMTLPRSRQKVDIHCR